MEIREGWGQENPAYRQIFTSRFIQDATPEQVRRLNELQRITTRKQRGERVLNNPLLYVWIVIGLMFVAGGLIRPSTGDPRISEPNVKSDGPHKPKQ